MSAVGKPAWGVWKVCEASEVQCLAEVLQIVRSVT